MKCTKTTFSINTIDKIIPAKGEDFGDPVLNVIFKDGRVIECEWVEFRHSESYVILCIEDQLTKGERLEKEGYFDDVIL